MAQRRNVRRKTKGNGVGLVLMLFFVAVLILTSGVVLLHIGAQNTLQVPFGKGKVLAKAQVASAYKKPLTAPSKRSMGPFFYLFVVLDDAGAALEQLDPFYEFPEFDKLSFAVLPHLEETQGVLRALATRNAAYILHMPMQPLGPQEPGPFALRVDYPAQKITALAVKNIESIPNLIGLNNHMGSAATQSNALMHALLTVAKERSLFFMDSRTSPRSVARSVAQRLRVPFIARDVFLDNEENVEYITRQLQVAVALARTRGFAVAIGHATKRATAEALKASYQGIKAQGAAFASLREYFLLTR